MLITRIKRLLLGEPLSSHKVSEEKIPKWKALAVLSSDALSSVAYATEEILIPLAVFSVAAMAYSVPVALAIVTLMVIVVASYRQTIQAYPNGGGAYVVAKTNLGDWAGLTAGAALLIGYVLTVSVSIAAGVQAITSAFPNLAEYRVGIAIFLIAGLTVMNLRGIRESATVFAFPTYLFLFCFFVMIVWGGIRILTGQVVAQAPVMSDVYPIIPIFLVLRAFSSGCAALTGIEAISNGVPAFKEPAAKNAKATLVWMAIILSFLFLGITTLSKVYGIVPLAGDGHGEVAVSQLARGIFGTGFFYYLIQVSTALILVLAANTSYNGLPWMAAIMAKDRYLPRQLAMQGDRLVFSNSILVLSFFAAFLIVIFGGHTHSLIPLYAVGVFLGFTLSQAGMLRHHLRHKQEGWQRGFFFNALGAVTTFVVMIVVGLTKFSEGAWIVFLVIPILVYVFSRIHQHYVDVGKELSLLDEKAPEHLDPYKHTVIVPLSGVHRGVVDALRYSLSISEDVRAVYVEINPAATEKMQKEWDRWCHDIPFVVLKSPYRSVIRPLLEYLDDLEQTAHGHMVTVVIPEFVTAKWWHQFLHNQTALLIRAAMVLRKRKVVTSVRYHLKNT